MPSLRALQAVVRETENQTLIVTLLGILTLFVLFHLATYIRNKFWPPVQSEASASLLNYNFLQFLPGLTRGDVEEQLVDAERWDCSICDFENLIDTLHCHLCGTPTQTTEVKSSKSTPIPTSKVHLKELNHRQLCARSRKKWVRHLSTDLTKRGVSWTTTSTHPPSSQSAFVIQGSSILADTDGNHCIQLNWIPVAECRADETVLGISLPSSIWAGLLHVSSMTFSLKYAWFLEQVMSMVLPHDKHRLRFKSTREDVTSEALKYLMQLKGELRCAAARYEFTNEAAIDGGALQREWYMIVAQNLMGEAHGLFSITNRETHEYFFNPDLATESRLSDYEAVGRFIGRAILDGQVLPMQFSSVFFKAILGIPVSIDDLECMDPQVHKSLLYVLHSETVNELGLTFSVTEPHENKFVENDLIPNGRNFSVTKENAKDYVDLMVKYLLFDRFKNRLAALLQGLYAIVPPELLLVFDFKELELLVCGLSNVDIDDWKLNTIVSSNLKNSPVLNWFWEVVTSLSPQEQSKLLQFCTGSSRVPVQGFKGKQCFSSHDSFTVLGLTSYDGNICHFSLCGIKYTPGAYPTAHACFNRLDLPLYLDKNQMKAAIQVLLQSDPTGFNLI